jgi:archaellum component FlaC
MMTTKNPGDSVQDEQFDGTEKAAESTQETNDAEAPALQPADALPAAEDEIREEAATDEKPAADTDITSTSDDVESKEDDQLTVEPVAEDETSMTEEPEADEPAGEEADAEETAVADPGKTGVEVAEQSGEETAVADPDKAGDEAAEKTEDESAEADQTEEEPVNYDEIELPPVDYSGFPRKELVETLALIVENRPPAEIIDDVARIKEFFYKKTKAEFNEKRLNFAKEGGNIEDYKSEPDELENRIKGILETYRSRRSDFNRIQESEKQENLRRKLEIIEQIKDLVNREEAINKTFQEFRNLQNSWHSTGIVPQTAVKDLWENYHHSVEMFYDYIKINRELRDLDLRKNLESKIVLCEKAEELLMEPNAVTAFKLLQDYHNQWREIGPVPHENKNDVWERFREATTKVNKRHHEYFEKQKDDQKKNLDAKTALCEKVEEIAAGEILTFADFKEKSDAILECQKLWKTIGFAPKKHNNKIYQRFRTACDNFFEKKRAFFADSKEIQVKNLQLKTELCLKAEALQESTDWKETSEMLIRLQKEWKETGPVPKKYSEKIWKRFRKACDTFFTRKSEFFAGRDTSYEDNLKSKLAIIEELEAFDPGDDMKAGFEKLKDIQKRWTEIGYVPFNRKEEIARRYKEALSKKFDKLKLDDEDKNILRYRSKVDSARSNPRAASKVRTEREKFYSRIKQLESDIVLWENNIGFFAKSAKADTMIREVEEKIAEARRNIKLLEEKVKLIDSSMYED